MSAPVLDVPVVETARLRLRALSEADLDPLSAFYASERSRFVGGPQGRAQTWRGLASMVGHWVLRGYGMWAVEEKATGAFCGTVGPLFPESWPEREIGWILTANAEGRGIGFEAASAARDFAYRRLGWTTAISLIAPENGRSLALARRLGARLDAEIDHEVCGRVQIWRHPAPSEAAA